MNQQAPETIPAPDPVGDAETLLPPRPNLGPEPWREQAGWGGWLVAVAAIAVLVAAMALRLRARRRRRRADGRTESAAGHDRQDLARTTADSLVARAEAIRSALIVAFGPAWAARTTEEIAGAPELAGRLGPDRASRVVALLADADHDKFAGGPAARDAREGDDAGRWVAEVVGVLTAGDRP